MDIQSWGWVALGGMAGACFRFGVSTFVQTRLGPEAMFPWGTLLINTTGSLAIGVVIGLLAGRPLDQAWRLVLVTGFLGGYTTFSAYSFEVVSLLQAQRWGFAAIYAASSTFLGVAGCGIGFWVSHLFNP